MLTYPGLPGPVIDDFLNREESRGRYAPGVEFHIGRIEMVANTGTYLDAPFHRYAHGKDLSQLPLSSLAALDCAVLHIAHRSQRAIGAESFTGMDLREKAVLVHTGWDIHWRTERYFTGHPFLTADCADHLVSSGVTLVGIDSLNIDDTEDAARPVHSRLLAAEIPIVEHLCNLGELPDRGGRFFAVPVGVKGLGSFPVRAFALVDDSLD
jgi:arylformamidase